MILPKKTIETQLDAAYAALDTYSEERSRLQREASALNLKLETERAQALTQRDTFEASRAELLIKYESLEGELTWAKTTSDALAAELAQVQASRDLVEAELAQIRARNDLVETELADLRSRCDILEAEGKRLLSLKVNLEISGDNTKARLDAAYLALEAVGEERSRLLQRSADLEACVAAAEARAEQITADRNAHVAEAQARADGFRGAYEAFIAPFTEKTVALNTALEAQRDTLEAQRSELLLQCDTLQVQLAQAHTEGDTLQAELAQVTRAHETAVEHFTEAVNRANTLEAQRSELLLQCDTLRVQLTQTHTERDTLQAELAQVTRAHETVVEHFTEAVIRANTLEDQRSQLLSQCAALQVQLGQMANSRSWRVTSPLRAAGVLARRVAHIPRRAIHLLLEVRSLPRRIVRSLRRRLGNARRLTATTLRRAVHAIRLFSRRLARHCVNGALDLLIYAAAWWRATFGRPRTMWGVTPILTLPLLARCDRLLGLRSDSLVFTTYYITRNFDINLKRLCEKIYTQYPRWTSRLHKVILRLALVRYDVFHLFCDRSLLLPTRRMEINEQEMQAIRRFGRRLYTYTYGADVRTRNVTLALGRYNICAECPEPMRFCMCDDVEGAANIARIRNSATAMIAMGDMLHYVPAARNFHFWPLDTAKMRYVGTQWTVGKPLRIAHTPNHPHFKGTHYLVAAIDRLRSQGHAIELVRVQGVPNSEVLALFENCDMVADQFIAGFHGYTALEAMALGKPVLCYLRDPRMAIDPAVCPMINTSPDTVYEVLLTCLDGRFDLAELGRRSRAYIEHYYSIEAIALRLGALYLETAEFRERTNRLIRRRMRALEKRLPPLLPGSPPVPWTRTERVETAIVE